MSHASLEAVYFEIIFHSMRQVFVWTQTWLLLTWKKDNPFLLPPPSISRPYCFFGIEKTNQKTPNVKITLDFLSPDKQAQFPSFIPRMKNQTRKFCVLPCCCSTLLRPNASFLKSKRMKKREKPFKIKRQIVDIIRSMVGFIMFFLCVPFFFPLCFSHFAL